MRTVVAALSAAFVPTGQLTFITTAVIVNESQNLIITVLGGAATCSEGFVLCFLKVLLACLGQHGSCSIAQQPGKKEKQNLRNNWPPPTRYVQSYRG